MENINEEEDEGKKVMRLRSGDIMQNLKVFAKENIEGGEHLMKLKKE